VNCSAISPPASAKPAASRSWCVPGNTAVSACVLKVDMALLAGYHSQVTSTSLRHAKHFSVPLGRLDQHRPSSTWPHICAKWHGPSWTVESQSQTQGGVRRSCRTYTRCVPITIGLPETFCNELLIANGGVLGGSGACCTDLKQGRRGDSDAGTIQMPFVRVLPNASYASYRQS
jgi:hypothetical protein